MNDIHIPKIALFGGGGVIGQSIASVLSKQGVPYRVVGRSQSTLQETFRHDSLAEVVSWNPDSPESLRLAASGIETLIYLVGVNYWQFELHPELMQKTLDGAIAAGVKKIVLIGTVYSYGYPQTNPVYEEHPREPDTFKGQMRKAQEDLLMAADSDGKIKATMLRLPDFYGPSVQASMLHGAAVAAVNGGTADMIGPIEPPHEFMFVPDVGPVVVKLLAKQEAYGKVWNFAGAGVTSQQALLQEMERQTGRPIDIRIADKAMLYEIGQSSPLMREMVEMHYLQTDPVLMDDTALQELLGPIYKTPYAEGIRQTLNAVETR